MTERVFEVANALNGTCDALSAHATEEEINSLAFCQLLDEQTMQCSACGWWTDADDVDDDSVCSECRE